MITIIALDISSTNIGVCLMHDGDPINVWSYTLKGTPYERGVQAYLVACQLADSHSKARLAIEAPAYASHEHVAIQRVTGAVLAAWCNTTGDVRVVEIAPTTAKLALTGSGRAVKATMIQYARTMLPDVVMSEHAADAMGVGLAAFGKLRQLELTQ